MKPAVLDTNAAVESLESGNFTRGQATALVYVLVDALEPLATKEELKALATKEELKPLATKEELKALATKEDIRLMRAEMQSLEARTQAAIAVSQKNIIVTTLTALVMVNGMFMALAKFL